MTSSIISFKQVSFSYEKGKKLIKDLELTINKGEKVGIIGDNGAGKSTLMKLIVGLIQPDLGSIMVKGLKVNKKNIKVIRQEIGYTFQDPDNQLFMPTVYEDVAFALRQEKKSEEDIKRLTDLALEAVGASHIGKKAPFRLSGGEKRLATLATALSLEPSILILDEPSVGLDPLSRRQLINLIRERQETVLITTHDMDMAMDLCNRIIVLGSGQVKADGSSEEIFYNEALLADNHLEMPLQLQRCSSCDKA